MRSVVLVAGIMMLPMTGLAAAAGLEGLVARGNYLVHHVCHVRAMPHATGRSRGDRPNALTQRRADPRLIAVPRAAMGVRRAGHRRPAGVVQRGRDDATHHRPPYRQRRAEAAHAAVPADSRGRRGRGRVSAFAAVRRNRGLGYVWDRPGGVVTRSQGGRWCPLAVLVSLLLWVGAAWAEVCKGSKVPKTELRRYDAKATLSQNQIAAALATHLPYGQPGCPRLLPSREYILYYIAGHRTALWAALHPPR